MFIKSTYLWNMQQTCLYCTQYSFLTVVICNQLIVHVDENPPRLIVFLKQYTALTRTQSSTTCLLSWHISAWSLVEASRILRGVPSASDCRPGVSWSPRPLWRGDTARLRLLWTTPWTSHFSVLAQTTASTLTDLPRVSQMFGYFTASGTSWFSSWFVKCDKTKLVQAHYCLLLSSQPVYLVIVYNTFYCDFNLKLLNISLCTKNVPVHKVAINAALLINHQLTVACKIATLWGSHLLILVETCTSWVRHVSMLPQTTWCEKHIQLLNWCTRKQLPKLFF